MNMNKTLNYKQILPRGGTQARGTAKQLRKATLQEAVCKNVYQ